MLGQGAEGSSRNLLREAQRAQRGDGERGKRGTRERESFSEQHSDIDVASVEQLRKCWGNVKVQTTRLSANEIDVRDRDREKRALSKSRLLG